MFVLKTNEDNHFSLRKYIQFIQKIKRYQNTMQYIIIGELMKSSQTYIKHVLNNFPSDY